MVRQVQFYVHTVLLLSCSLVGPMVFAPLSELYGGKIIYVSTLLIGLLFIIPGAVAKNIGTLLVARLIDGIGFRCVRTFSAFRDGSDRILVHP